jgi:uncharacterized secreted repeat protein (TIGR03808 family)
MNNRLTNRRQFLIQAGTLMTALGFTRPVLARDAREFGVIPDKREDQSAAFQKMLDIAARQRSRIYLAHGTYAISEIKLPDFVDLAGKGDQTTLVNTTRNSIFTAQHSSRVMMDNILVDGVHLGHNDENVALIDLRRVGNVELTGLMIRRARHDALRLEQCGGSIKRCTISDAGRLGLFSMASKALQISENTVEDCANGGIIVHRHAQGYDGARINNNIIRRISASRGGTGQWGNGINIYKTNDVEIIANKVEDCAFSAIRANTAHDFKMNDNTCLRSGETAIYAEFAFRNAEIKNNTVIDAANGISAVNADVGGGGAVITGNVVKDINAIGPYDPPSTTLGNGINVEADTLVAGNTIENTARYGVNAGWGPHLRNVDLIGNTIKNSRIGIGISAAKGAGSVNVKGNQISAREGNIHMHKWEKINPIDIGLNPAQAPAHITLEGNVTS